MPLWLPDERLLEQAEQEARELEFAGAWEEAAEEWLSLLDNYPRSNRCPSWQAALARCRDEAELANLCSEGLDQFRRGHLAAAEELLRVVWSRRPDQMCNGRPVGALLEAIREAKRPQKLLVDWPKLAVLALLTLFVLCGTGGLISGWAWGKGPVGYLFWTDSPTPTASVTPTATMTHTPMPTGTPTATLERRVTPAPETLSPSPTINVATPTFDWLGQVKAEVLAVLQRYEEVRIRSHGPSFDVTGLESVLAEGSLDRHLQSVRWQQENNAHYLITVHESNVVEFTVLDPSQVEVLVDKLESREFYLDGVLGAKNTVLNDRYFVRYQFKRIGEAWYIVDRTVIIPTATAEPG
jgi:hypothetical protein